MIGRATITLLLVVGIQSVAAAPNYAAVFGGATGQVVKDRNGNFYIAGSTQYSIATTPGAFQTSVGRVLCDGINPSIKMACFHGFVVKISPDGKTVLFATYLSGSNNDYIATIAVDDEGNVFAAGNTQSKDFPVTSGPYPGPTATFILKLSADGSRVLASTWLPGATAARALALDGNHNLYIAGATTSDNFPTTTGAIQKTPYPGYNDVFVMIIDDTLRNVSYSTLLGGTYDDVPNAMVLDKSGNVYLAGYTTSTPSYIPKPDAASGLALFPVTAGAFNHPGNGADAFIAKLNPRGEGLIYSAVFGGTGNDFISSIAVGSDGAVYATGNDESPDFPITTSAFQTSLARSFVLKLAPDSSKLEYSTFLGTPRTNAGWIQVDQIGNAFVTGYSDIFPYPTTPDSANPCFPVSGDLSNPGFLTVLNPSGTSLVYSSYLQGTLLFAPTGDVWVQGSDSVIDQFNIFQPREPNITCVTNAATFFGQSVAPGEIVSVFGPGIGPDQPVGLQLDFRGRVASELAGVSVRFNGIAAPLLYLSKHQINAVVPFNVTGPVVSVEVVRDGKVIGPSQFRYSDSNPGIFTMSGSGYGQGAVLNQDSTLNSPSNPAKQGSIISIYATGLGKMTSTEDGYVPTGPTAAPILQVSAGISLYPLALDILYAGDAPGSVEGLVQINARLPHVLFDANPPPTQVYVQVGTGATGAFAGSPTSYTTIWIQ